MAKTKAEMESDRKAYRDAISNARQAIRDGCYSNAVRISSSSWGNIDGMMQFERKYENREFDSIEGISIVLKYAPLLFDSEVLNSLDILLKSQRRIDKYASNDMAGDLANARNQMWDAHRLWDFLEQNGDTIQSKIHVSLGGDQQRWNQIVESWEQMGLVRRILLDGDHAVSLATLMEAVIAGKCPKCGVFGKIPKRKCLVEICCPKCRQTVVFLIT